MPVIQGGSRGTIVDAALNRSPLRYSFKVKRLTKSMRVMARGDSQLVAFDEWTVKIGDGLAEINSYQIIYVY